MAALSARVWARPRLFTQGALGLTAKLQIISKLTSIKILQLCPFFHLFPFFLRAHALAPRGARRTIAYHLLSRACNRMCLISSVQCELCGSRGDLCCVVMSRELYPEE